MPAGVEIVLGANFDDAQKAMNAFNQGVTQFVNQMAGLFAAAGANVEEFQNSLRSLIDVQKGLTTAIGNTNTTVSQTTNIINNVRTSTRGLTNDFGVLSYTMTRTIHGFAELFVRPGQALLILSNDIPQLVTRVRELAQEQKALAAAGQPAISTMGLLAKAFDPLIFSIQIGLTALLRYGPELFKWATGMDVAAKAAKEAEKQQKALNQAFETGVSSTAKEINKVQLLTSQMNDANSTSQQRINKYNELIALYPQLYIALEKEKNYNTESISRYDLLTGGVDGYKEKIRQLTEVINTDLIPALRNQAIAQGFAAQVAKISEQVTLLIAQSDKLKSKAIADKTLQIRATAPYQSLIDAAKANPTNERLQNTVTQLYASKLDKVTEASEKSTKAYVENQVQVAKLTKDIDGLLTHQLKYDGQVQRSIIGGITNKQALEGQKKAAQAVLDNLKAGTPEFAAQEKVVQGLTDKLKAYDITATHVSKHSAKTFGEKQEDKLKNILASYDKSRQTAQLQRNAGQIDQSRFIEQVLNATNAAISAISQLHIPEKDTILGKLMGDRQSLIKQLNVQDLADAMNDEYAKQKNKFQKLQKERLGKPLGDGLKIDNAASSGLRDLMYKASQNGLDLTQFADGKNDKERFKNTKKGLDDLVKHFKQTGRVINQVIGGPLDDMISALAKGENFAESFAKSIGKMVMNIAEAALKAAVLAGLMSAIDPEGAKAVKTKTGASSLFGALLSGAIGAIPFLAEGGIVTGPTLAMIGEAGSEAVVPLNKMNSFQNGTQQLTLRTRWRGRDIEGATDNYNKLKGY